MSSFTEGNKDIFHGRKAQVEKLYKILNDKPVEPVVAVVMGDSGSGKTSLLQAGLTPKVRSEGLAGRKGWRIVVLRPGDMPDQTLMRSLLLNAEEGAALTNSTIPESKLKELPILLKEASSAERPLLLILDQFEEMFTLCKEEAQRQDVARWLVDAAKVGADHFRLVLGIRIDYRDRTAALPGMQKFIESPLLLSPPGSDEVKAIVYEPATRYGYDFEDPLPATEHIPQPKGLLDRILDDPLLKGTAPETTKSKAEASRTSAPLPLLEFALERLWLMAVERDALKFTHADFDKLGGLAGAIAQHAEEVYARLPTMSNLGPNAQQLAEKIITGLVSSQNTRRPRKRADLDTETGNAEAASRVIDYLVAERLLSVRSDPTNFAVAQIELAHEVLIDRWRRLQEWLALDPEGRALMEAFQTDASKWEQGLPGGPPRSMGGLPSTGVAAIYLEWIKKKKLTLTPSHGAFAAALRSLVGRFKFRRRAVLIVLLGLTAAALVFAVISWLQEKSAQEQWYLATLNVADRSCDEGNFDLASKLLDKLQESPIHQERKSFAFYWLWRRCHPANVLEGHTGPVLGLEFMPKSGRLQSAAEVESGRHCEMKVWDLDQREPIENLTFDENFNQQSLSLSGEQLVLGLSRTGDPNTYLLKVWNATTKSWRVLGPRPGVLHSLAFSHDGALLASGSGIKESGGVRVRGDVRLWNIQTGEELPQPNLGENVAGGIFKGGVYSLAFSRQDSGLLAAGYEDGDMIVWHTKDGKLLHHLQCPHDRLLSLVFSPFEENRLASGSHDGRASVWNLGNEMEERHFTGDGQISTLVFSHDGKKLAAGGSDGVVSLWNPDRDDKATLFRGHSGGVTSLAFSTDDQQLASGGMDKKVLWWNVHQADAFEGSGKTNILSMAFSPDGDRLAFDGPQNAIKFINVGGRREEQPDALMKMDSGITCITISKDGKNLAAGGYNSPVKLWNLGSPDSKPVELSAGEGVTGVVRSVAFSPTGKKLAFGGWDGIVRLWDYDLDIPTPHPLEDAHKGEVNSLTFSPNGLLACAYKDTTVECWDLSSSTAKNLFRDKGVSFWSLAFSPDGTLLAAGGMDHMVTLWNAKTGEKVGNLSGHKDEVYTVAFSPDGKTLASGSHDGLVKLWDVRTRDNIATLKDDDIPSLASIQFSPDENEMMLAVRGVTGKVKLWRAATQPEVDVWMRDHPKPSLTRAWRAIAAWIVAALLGATALAIYVLIMARGIRNSRMQTMGG